MSHLLVATPEEVIEQILVQCWMFQAREGDRAGARAKAERTLERLLSRGLPARRGPRGSTFLDPYGASNALKSRAGEPADESFADWQATTRRNAASLPVEPHRYRLTLRREWHAFKVVPGRPLVFRLPLPLRGSRVGRPEVVVLEPGGGHVDRQDAAGRVELRLDSPVPGPVVAEMTVEFVGGEHRDSGEPGLPLGAGSTPEEEAWMRPREGLIAPSPSVDALATRLAEGCRTARELVHATWDWMIANLRFGDVHRECLEAGDPLGSLLRSRTSDCVLGSSLLVAICRARGVPARLLSGFLLHPANVGPHAWAEVRVAAGRWAPVDFGSWVYCAGDVQDPQWGRYFLGRVDARFVAEVLPREFVGWGCAPPPERWYRLERLAGNQIEHTLHALSDGALVRRDRIALEVLGPADPPGSGTAAG